MQSTPKIRGYIAEEKNIITLLYRRSGKVTYLLVMKYGKGRETFEVGSPVLRQILSQPLRSVARR